MDIYSKFDKVIDEIYGTYLDAIDGFSQLVQNLQKEQHQLLNDKSFGISDIKDLDSADMTYGRGDPNDPNSTILHKSSQKEYKIRNMEGGRNFKFLGNMALVSLYQYWEDNFRDKIAKIHGVDKNDFKVPIMGDLRLLRRSIIHHAGLAIRDVESCEILNWYSEDDEIFINKEKLEKIIFEIKSEIKKWRINN